MSKQGNLLLVLTFPFCSRDPNKALPEFLVWPPVNVCSLRKAKTLVGIRATHEAVRGGTGDCLR